MSFGQLIALASFIFSAGTIALTYWVGISQETVEVCVPFIDGCTDITHTGLAGDAGFIFRGGMISASVLILVWWHCMRVWLQPSIQSRAGRVNLNLMTFFGMLAGIGLVVSTFQAATQINEQTLSFLPRLLITLIVIIVWGPWMLTLLLDHANGLISSIPFLIG